jgi:hypothetical protein
VIRRFLFCAAVAAGAGTTAAAATGVHWGVLQTGKTVQVSSAPSGFVAITRAQERRFTSRLSTESVAALHRLNLQRTGVVAVFLDGLPCSGNVTVQHVTRTATTVTVSLGFQRPPIGVATCVRISTPWAIIGVSRQTLGHPAPTHVRVVAVARA